jgi:hypothetical protein
MRLSSILPLRVLNYIGNMKALRSSIFVAALSVRLLTTAVVAGQTASATPTRVWTNGLPPDAQTVLHEAEKFELYSLDPEASRISLTNNFHGWNVAGSTTITNAQTRKELITAFEKGVKGANMLANCFEPRHGIRATKGTQTFDFVICFRCLQVVLFDEHGKESTVCITASPQPTFEKVLIEERVPAPPRHDRN